MRNIKDFQARYDRWKNGERYWDIRGVDLPRYDTGDKNTVVTDDGSVFNIDPSAIGARNLEVTTPDVEVIGKKQYPYQSAFNPYALTEGIQYALGNFDGIILNAGAYTHYSYAIRDALASIEVPKVEIHISDITQREEFRKISVTKEVCDKQIYGHGLLGYLEAIDFLLAKQDKIV